jgi:hypothetical protein
VARRTARAAAGPGTTNTSTGSVASSRMGAAPRAASPSACRCSKRQVWPST